VATFNIEYDMTAKVWTYKDGELVITAERSYTKHTDLRVSMAVYKGKDGDFGKGRVLVTRDSVTLSGAQTRERFIKKLVGKNCTISDDGLLALDEAIRSKQTEQQPQTDPKKAAAAPIDYYETAKELLNDPKLLERVGHVIKASGYAGDLKPPKVGYMVATSRLLERPNNLTFTGPSASGKSAAVDSFLQLIPEEDYYLEKAGSARALVYNDADYSHKMIVVAEADSLPEDGPAASAVRSLASDNEMSYDVVERNPETGAFFTRRIIKPGPTCLITTTTKPLKWQMDTRMLASPIPDTKEATKEVLHAHADSVNGRSRPSPDLAPFLALQWWLRLAGGRRVIVPFASALAEKVPPDHVRMRRDFRQLLTLIQSCALLHQCQRPRSADGAIVATIEDYRLVRELALDIFTAAATGGITPQVRQTVEAVKKLAVGEKTAKVVDVARELRLSTEAAWYRVQRAIKLSYIVNQETRDRQPAKLVPGDPLPDATDTLPKPEDVQVHMSVHPPKEDLNIETPSVAAIKTQDLTAINRDSPSAEDKTPIKAGNLIAPTGSIKRLNGVPAGGEDEQVAALVEDGSEGGIDESEVRL